MLDCPHCSQPIQEEATFCKHCHQEVEPPLWVNSMRRCPYCAEWIDLEHENCQYCGKHVGVVDLTESSAFLESLLSDDFLDDLPETEGRSAGPSPFIGDDSRADRLAQESELASLERKLSFLEDDPFEQGLEGEHEGRQPPGAAHQSPFIESDAFDLDSQSPFPTGDQTEFSLDQPLTDDEPAESGPSPSLPDRQPPDFSRDLRRSLIGNEAAEAADFQSQFDEELEEDLEPEPGFSPEQPYDRELAYGTRPGYEQQPTYQADEDEPESEHGYESEAERRARDSSAARGGEADFVPVPSADPEAELGSSIWASEVTGLESLRSKAPAPPSVRRELPAGVLQGVVGLLLIGGLGYGLVALVRGPAGAMLAETLATDVPTDTPIPAPTATRSTAPTLPPETPLAAEPTALAGGETAECLSWDQVGLDDEGSELCVYGVIRRWFAVSEVPFVAIFSEVPGTFAIVDRTTTHPVGPGDCIVARGPVEVMSRTRPDIDLNGTLELCPAEWLAEG